MDEDLQPTTQPEALGFVSDALWRQAEGRRVGRLLQAAGIPVVVLKGPELQLRLYGTPAVYASGDVDLLVPRGRAARARRVLESDGFAFAQGNGVLWRIAEQATYVRDSFAVDLHWGLQIAHMPGVAMRRLERVIWAGARPGPSGMLEPDPEALCVYLAAHAAGHGHVDSIWTENVLRSAALIRDRERLKRIARHARLERTTREVLAGTHDFGTPVLDGAFGRLVWVAAWLVRGQFIPQAWRDRLRTLRPDRTTAPRRRDG